MNITKFALLLGLALGVYGCSGDGGSDQVSNDGSNAGFNVISSSMNHFNGGLQKIGENGVVDPSIQIPVGIIGYDSALKQPAQVNCYNYTVTGSGVSGGVSVEGTNDTQTTNDTLGVSASISAKFGLFSTKDSVSYSQSTSSSAQSVNVSVMSEQKALINFTIDPTTPFVSSEYETIYETDPTLFAFTCGDQILTQMPVHNLLVAQMNFYTTDASFNRKENVRLGGKYLFTKVTADIQASQGGSQSKLNATLTLNNVGAMDANQMSTALTAIGACLDTGSGCGDAMTKLTPIAYAGMQDALASISAGNKTWMQDLSPDYTNNSLWKFSPAQDVISITQTISNQFEPYVARLTNAINVYADLLIADAVITSDIAPSIETNLSGITLKDILYNNAEDMGGYYTKRISNTDILTNLENLINGCLSGAGSTTGVEWIAACEAIDPNMTMASVIEADDPDKWKVQKQYVPMAKAAYTATAYGLLYDTTIEGSLLNATSQKPEAVSTLGHLVWLPRSDGQLAIALLPNANTNAADTQGVYYFQNAATTEDYYYPKVEGGVDWFIYNPSKSYRFGINYSQAFTNNGVLMMSDDSEYLMTELIESPGKAATCGPFGTYSSGCIYYDLVSDPGSFNIYYPIPNYTFSQIDPKSGGFPSTNGVGLLATTEDNYHFGNTPFFFSINPFK